MMESESLLDCYCDCFEKGLFLPKPHHTAFNSVHCQCARAVVFLSFFLRFLHGRKSMHEKSFSASTQTKTISTHSSRRITRQRKNEQKLSYILHIIAGWSFLFHFNLKITNETHTREWKKNRTSDSTHANPLFVPDSKSRVTTQRDNFSNRVFRLCSLLSITWQDKPHVQTSSVACLVHTHTSTSTRNVEKLFYIVHRFIRNIFWWFTQQRWLQIFLFNLNCCHHFFLLDSADAGKYCGEAKASTK